METCDSCGQRLPHVHAARVEAECWFCRELAVDPLLAAAWDALSEDTAAHRLARMSIEAARSA